MLFGTRSENGMEAVFAKSGKGSVFGVVAVQVEAAFEECGTVKLGMVLFNLPVKAPIGLITLFKLLVEVAHDAAGLAGQVGLLAFGFRLEFGEFPCLVAPEVLVLMDRERIRNRLINLHSLDIKGRSELREVLTVSTNRLSMTWSSWALV